MKYFIQLKMEGIFPGSPDLFSSEISERDYDKLMERYIMKREKS